MRTRTTIAALSALVLLLAACGSDDVDLAVDAADDVEADDAGDPDTEAGAGDATEAPTTDPATSTPTPDPALVADPCAAHEGREMDSFIDLVAPVDEQVASGSVEIVGCANVFEANVVWHLLDGDGALLDEGFTTAECGTGCVGAFSDEVPLDVAAGEPVVYLQVFSPNVSGEGPEQLQLVERIVVLD